MEWIYKYISATAVIGGLWFFIKYYIQKNIDSYFSSKLAVHEQQLNDLSEKTRYYLSKQLFDFEAYATKKHEVYPVVYSKIFETFSKIKEYQMDIEGEFNLEENRLYDLTNDHQVEFNRDLLYYKFQKTTEVNEVYKTITEYYYGNELFLSKPVALKCDYILKLMDDMITGYFHHEYDKPVLNANLLELENKVEEIKAMLHEELSYSHHVKEWGN